MTYAHTSFAILSATSAAHGAHNSPSNLSRAMAMRVALATLRLDFHEVYGVYKGVPDGVSFLVLDPDMDSIMHLAKQFQQESVLTPKGLVTPTGEVLATISGPVLMGDEARAQDFYSVLLNGDAFSFPLAFVAADV